MKLKKYAKSIHGTVLRIWNHSANMTPFYEPSYVFVSKNPYKKGRVGWDDAVGSKGLHDVSSWMSQLPSPLPKKNIMFLRGHARCFLTVYRKSCIYFFKQYFGKSTCVQICWMCMPWTKQLHTSMMQIPTHVEQCKIETTHPHTHPDQV